MPMYDELLLARQHPAQEPARRPRIKLGVREDAERRRPVRARRRVRQTSASWR
jgi:hypothetical protein